MNSSRKKNEVLSETPHPLSDWEEKLHNAGKRLLRSEQAASKIQIREIIVKHTKKSEYYLVGCNDLCLLSKETDVKYGTLYLSKTDNNHIAYTIMTPNGCTMRNIDTGIDAPQQFTLSQLNSLKDNIISVVLRKGHAINISNETEEQLIKRMLAQIQVLAEKAATQHYQDNFSDNKEDKIPTMLSECKYHVTRLTTPEFFFYPSKQQGPLTEDGFGELIERLEETAKTLPENLHLVLGTFPVVNKKREVRNVAVYIQCGPIPQINVIIKAMPAYAGIDPLYPNTQNLYYDGVCRERWDTNNIGNFIDHMGGLVSCKVSDAKFYTAVEICRDHITRIGGLATEQQILHYNKNLSLPFPTHMSHILISDTVSPEERYVLADKLLLQADPEKFGLKKISFFFNQKTISPLNPEKKEENITACFSGEIDIYTYPPQPLSQIEDSKFHRINNYNELLVTFKTYLNACAAQSPDAAQLNQVMNQKIQAKLILELKALNYSHRDVQTLRNKMIHDLNQLNPNEPNYRSMLKQYLTSQLSVLDVDMIEIFKPLLSAAREMLEHIESQIDAIPLANSAKKPTGKN